MGGDDLGRVLDGAGCDSGMTSEEEDDDDEEEEDEEE